MKRAPIAARGLALVAAALLSGTVAAKLPPATPEERAAQEARRVAEQAQLERAKAALERTQDAVAERYRREHPGAGDSNGGGRVSDTNMPYPTRQLPPAGPHGGDRQSAEAHSAPAK